jgi:hypothetical protein
VKGFSSLFIWWPEGGLWGHQQVVGVHPGIKSVSSPLSDRGPQSLLEVMAVNGCAKEVWIHHLTSCL